MDPTESRPPLRALIFDFNGVLSDDEAILYELYRDVLAEEGVALTEADYQDMYLGLDDRDIFAKALRAAGQPAPEERVARMVDRKVAGYLKRVTQAPPVPPAIIPFVKGAATRYLLAVASGAPGREIAWVLEVAGIRDCFRVIVALEDVTRGKPDPEPFLTALARLNALAAAAEPILPAQCLVIEDSVAGIRAARAAGMRCLAVATSQPPDRLREADAVIASVDELAREVHRLSATG